MRGTATRRSRGRGRRRGSGSRSIRSSYSGGRVPVTVTGTLAHARPAWAGSTCSPPTSAGIPVPKIHPAGAAVVLRDLARPAGRRPASTSPSRCPPTSSASTSAAGRWSLSSSRTPTGARIPRHAAAVPEGRRPAASRRPAARRSRHRRGPAATGSRSATRTARRMQPIASLRPGARAAVMGQIKSTQLADDAPARLQDLPRRRRRRQRRHPVLVDEPGLPGRRAAAARVGRHLRRREAGLDRPALPEPRVRAAWATTWPR